MDNDYEGAYGACDLNAFETALQQWGLSFEAVDDETLVVPAEGLYPLLLTTIQVTDGQATLDTLFPFQAPTERRARTMELAARLNARLSAGAITTNPDDGELGFRTCLPMPAERITVTLAAEALERHWAAANRVVPGLAVVVFTDLSLQVAMAQNEGTTPIEEVVQRAVRLLDVD